MYTRTLFNCLFSTIPEVSCIDPYIILGIMHEDSICIGLSVSTQICTYILINYENNFNFVKNIPKKLKLLIQLIKANNLFNRQHSKAEECDLV